MVARAWVLNFDAEAELEDPSARTPSRAVEARGRALAGKVRDLLGPGDVVITGATVAPGCLGRAWCPTPSALAALRRAGARLPAVPPFEVICRVNHRRFSADLGQTIPGARYVTSRADLDEAIAARPGAWLLKRPFGFAGRGRLVVRAGAIGDLDERWIAASLARAGGLQAEPRMDRTADFGIHGHLSRSGALAIGEPTRQVCDDRGAWVESARAAPGDLSPSERAALLAEVERTAGALARAGYFGPFGIDAFRHTAGFNPRCEINARYSMGWAAGMGAVRPDLEDEG